MGFVLFCFSNKKTNGFCLSKIKKRCEQGSNLRGETPLDFKSNALTTRPSQHVELECNFSIINISVSLYGVRMARITNMAKDVEEVDDVIAKLSGPS